MYVASLILFGTNGIVASTISLGSYHIVLFRTLIGSLFLLSVFVMMHGRFTRASRRQRAFLVLSGVFMGVSWMFQYEAYREIGIGMTSLLYCCGPALVMLASPIVFRERVTGTRLCGFAIVVMGAVLLSLQGLEAVDSAWGLFCGIMTAVTYALLIVFNKMATDYRGLENSALQLSVSFVTVMLFVVLFVGLPSTVLLDDVLPLLVLGLVNTGFGCLLYFTSIKDLETQTVAVCDYLEPLSAVFFAVILLSEPFSPVQFAGALLIILGTLVGERRHRVPSR